MSLNTEQAAFLLDMCKLIQYATDQGFVVTGGELARTPEQQAIYFKTGRSKTMNSIHLKRCAIDLNFFRDGKIIWDKCGMERTKEGLQEALTDLPALYNEFQTDLRVTGTGETTNQTLEKAGRVDDFFQLGMAMCQDALTREESCGAHFRSEYQTEEGEALRNDDKFCHVAAWEWTNDPMKPTRHAEELVFETAHLATRSYK